MKIVIHIFITAAALLFAATVVPGIEVSRWYTAIIAAVVLGLLNLIVRPILVVLTLPITLLTLGLFTFFINAALFIFAASFIEGFSVNGFLPALLGSLCVSVISMLGHTLTAS